MTSHQSPSAHWLTWSWGCLPPVQFRLLASKLTPSEACLAHQGRFLTSLPRYLEATGCPAHFRSLRAHRSPYSAGLEYRSSRSSFAYITQEGPQTNFGLAQQPWSIWWASARILRVGLHPCQILICSFSTDHPISMRLYSKFSCWSLCGIVPIQFAHFSIGLVVRHFQHFRWVSKLRLSLAWHQLDLFSQPVH